MKLLQYILTLIASATLTASCSSEATIGEEQQPPKTMDGEVELSPAIEISDGVDEEVTTRSQVFRIEDGMEIGVVVKAIDEEATKYGSLSDNYANGYAVYYAIVDSVNGWPDVSTARWRSKKPIVMSYDKAHVYGFYPTKLYMGEGLISNIDGGYYRDGTRFFSVQDKQNNRIHMELPTEFYVNDPVGLRAKGKAATALTPQADYAPDHMVDWMYAVLNDGYRKNAVFNVPTVWYDSPSCKLYMRHAQALIRIILNKSSYVNAEAGAPGSISKAYMGDISKIAPPEGETPAEKDSLIFNSGRQYFHFDKGTFSLTTGKKVPCLTWDFTGTNTGTSSGTPYTDEMQARIDTLSAFISPCAGERGVVKIGLVVDGIYLTTKALSNYRWEAGKVYTYVINIGNKPLEIEKEGVSVNGWNYEPEVDMGECD